MLAKNWKKIGMIILIIACVWNITSKFIRVVSFDKAIDSVKDYVTSIQNNDKK